MTIRVDDELARFVDETSRADEVSRADVINRALRREVRRRHAENDGQIYAFAMDTDLESEACAAWAVRSAGQVWSGLD